MSGIYGMVHFDHDAVQKNKFERLLGFAEKRRCDTENRWIDANAAFGAKILWTTPESVNEKQPLVDELNQTVLVADARIDNREELCNAFGIQNTEVVTDSDLIALAYRKWGEESSRYLIGDFSYALWDAKAQKLICSRDRFGIKPLFFSIMGQEVCFSSDIEVLYLFQKEKIKLNHRAVQTFLNFSTVGYEETMYEGIYRVPPSYSFVFTLEGISKQRYWFPEKVSVDDGISFEDAKQKVRELLFQAVRSCLRSEGKVGCELSGGLDSSAVALITQQMIQSDFSTFSMRCSSYACDEWRYAKNVVDTIKSDAVILDIDQLDYQDQYRLSGSVELNHYWPMYGSFTANYALGETMVEKGIKVCLTGHGGDHLFTGDCYPIDEYLKHFRFKYALCEFLYTDSRLALLKSLIPFPFKQWIKKYFLGYINTKYRKRIEDFWDYWKLTSFDSSVQQTTLDYLMGRHHVTFMDDNHYRVLEGLEPIEFRHPFFDTRLVEYVLTLPNHYKYRDGMIKIILREALQGLYPPSIYQREDKSEFSEALYAQMRHLDIHKLLKTSHLVLYGWIEESKLEEKIKAFNDKTIDVEGIAYLWRVVTMELWIREQDML